MNAGHPPADPGDRLPRHGHAHGQLLLAAGRRGHPLQHRVGHDHPRHLVPHEQGVAVAHQRPDAGEDRDAQRLRLVEHPQQGVGVNTGWVMANSSLLHFPAEALDFAAAVQVRRVQADADHRHRLRVDGLAAQVDAGVQRRCTATMPIESASNTPVACG